MGVLSAPEEEVSVGSTYWVRKRDLDRVALRSSHVSMPFSGHPHMQSAGRYKA